MKFLWKFSFDINGKEESHEIAFHSSKYSGKKKLWLNKKKIHEGPGSLLGWFNYKFNIDNHGNTCLIKHHEKDYSIWLNDIEFS